MTPARLIHSANPYTILNQTFVGSAKEISESYFKKSYAQVASLVAPHVAHSVAHEVAPHSAGLHPRPRKSKKSSTHGLRLRSEELELLRSKADELNMSLNAYIRAKALGNDYIEKPPEWLRDILLKLYVEFSRQGNNLNQIARQVNCRDVAAEAALITVDRQKHGLFRLMERLELALSGRRPPHDY